MRDWRSPLTAHVRRVLISDDGMQQIDVLRTFRHDIMTLGTPPQPYHHALRFYGTLYSIVVLLCGCFHLCRVAGINGLTENAGRENDGPSKLHDTKLMDQFAGHEIARQKISGNWSVNFTSSIFSAPVIHCVIPCGK